MKRSEMVVILTDAINYITGDGDCYISDSASDKILTKLEKAGMLPPNINSLSLGFASCNLWEPENE